MERQTWNDEELELLRKNLYKPQAYILSLFPNRTKWSVLGAKWRMMDNKMSTAGTRGYKRIRNDGGDGIPPYVHKILESCTYRYACKHRGDKDVTRFWGDSIRG